MTQEDKQLLLKDLCARLPYGLVVKYSCSDEPSKMVPYDVIDVIDNLDSDEEPIIRPYLRSMSSMTIDEEQHIAYLKDWASPENYIDYCLTNHIDYRGLIEKGLALEASDGMYKTE